MKINSLQQKRRNIIENILMIKIHFLILLDGVLDIPPVIEGIDSFTLGITKLLVEKNELHVFLRQPGLLIGDRGKIINKLMLALKHKIIIHESSLM